MRLHGAMTDTAVPTHPSPRSRPFAQVDVFTSGSLTGNPVAVVLDGADLTDEQMGRFAHWTNLSETTFVCPPTDERADYRLRIFTPGSELPFAGHPTLGSAHAWLAAGGVPQGPHIVQECGAGLVTVARDGDRLAFAAPPLQRSGPVDADTVTAVATALGLGPGEILDAQWVANGPQWMALRLESAARVLDVRPDFAALGDHEVGLVGAYPPGSPVAFELRAFAPGDGVPEDPVTGSLNAGVAMWLRGAGLAPAHYVAGQGTVLGRRGRVVVDDDGTDIWVGGVATTIIEGRVDL